MKKLIGFLLILNPLIITFLHKFIEHPLPTVMYFIFIVFSTSIITGILFLKNK